MLRKPSKKKAKTVSDKIVDELKRQERGSDDSDDSAGDAGAPRVIDFDDDEYELPDGRTTDIRKRNVKLLSDQSAKYRGKVATRRDIEDESDSEDEQEVPWQDDSDTDDDTLKAFSKKFQVTGDDSDTDDDALNAFSKEIQVTGDDSDVDDEDVDTDDDDDDDDDNDDAENDKTTEDEEDDNSAAESDHGVSKTDLIAESNRQAELQKGECVQNQLRIWERLLEVRIHMQKLLSKSNQLPTPLPDRTTDQDRGTYATAHKVANFLGSLVELQAKLSEQFSELQSAMSSSLKRPLPKPIDAAESDATAPPQTKRFAEHLGHQFAAFRPYRNAVLLKWDDRMRLTTPGAGARRKTLTEEYDVIRKIDNALLQRDVLVAKSQIDKSASSAPAENTETTAEEHEPSRLTNEELMEKQSQSKPKRNANIYDDSEFYHQQLRELIEYKANVSSSMTEVTKQYVELQKLRQKMKKKVDTRASKGRKMRYAVHKKLINFMAPNDASTWTDDSKNELCKSLFAT